MKTRYICKDFSNVKRMIAFNNYSIKSKYYDNSNKLVVGRMKNKTPEVAIYEFDVLKPKTYSYLVDDNGKHKIAKSVNKNVVTTTSRDEYKNVLLNKKRLKHLMNKIRSRDLKMGT